MIQEADIGVGISGCEGMQVGQKSIPLMQLHALGNYGMHLGNYGIVSRT